MRLVEELGQQFETGRDLKVKLIVYLILKDEKVDVNMENPRVFHIKVGFIWYLKWKFIYNSYLSDQNNIQI